MGNLHFGFRWGNTLKNIINSYLNIYQCTYIKKWVPDNLKEQSINLLIDTIIHNI